MVRALLAWDRATRVPAVGLMLLGFVIAAGLQPPPVSAVVLGSLLGVAFLTFGFYVRAETGRYGTGDCRPDFAPVSEADGELATCR